MPQVFYPRHSFFVPLLSCFLLLVALVSCQASGVEHSSRATTVALTPALEGRDATALLLELQQASGGDEETLARILVTTPSSLERLCLRQTEPTPEFAQRIRSAYAYYQESGRSFRRLRQALDPEYSWYEYILHYPLVHPLRPLLTLVGLLLVYRFYRQPFLIILPLFLCFFLWIVALIYTSMSPKRSLHDHYREQLNPKVELRLQSRRS